MTIRIAHECPKSLFDRVSTITDYDYALVHLFEEDGEYYDQFVIAKAKGREIVLENSIFELEEAFDPDRFAYWVTRLKPHWYIIPDVLEDCDQTIKNVEDWVENYSKPNQFNWFNSKSIGVVQGKSYAEIVKCYQAIEPLVDKVAISFDYSFFRDIPGEYPTKYHMYVKGRQMLIDQLLADGIINRKKLHHLLGCGLPQEFAHYNSPQYAWIDTLDTSNPVVAGLKGIKYNAAAGLEDKPSEKLFTMINHKPTSKETDDIIYNIFCFRTIIHG